jgi:hypothetical protein
VRVILDVTFPTVEFNAAVQDGTAGKKLERILASLKPEAVYFTSREGQRSAIVALDLPNESSIPAVAEPWYLTFNAKVDFRVAMSPQDLAAAGLDKLGKEYS